MARSTYRVNRENLPAKDSSKKQNRSASSRSPIRIGDKGSNWVLCNLLYCTNNIILQKSSNEICQCKTSLIAGITW